jgi:ABC-type uncharacterized transport system substrate-binding protein
VKNSTAGDEKAAAWIARGLLPFLSCMALSLILSGCGAFMTRPVPPIPDSHDTSAAFPVVTKLVVLVSDESPAFVDVANGIVARSTPRPEIYNLKGDATRASEVIRTIAVSNDTIVVAVGMVAANAARQLQGKRVIFCQVFNPEQAGLITPWMRGVSALPPAAKSLRAWKRLDPRLTRVGVITGDGLDDLLNEARAAARENGLHLTVVTVRSDKEMLYAYKRMHAKIEGFWLIPDNRVLSSDVLRELMAFSVKQGKQVMVFSPELLQHGGVISVESDPQDIATLVLARVREIGGARVVPGPAVSRLTQVRVQVNSMMAKALGIKTPAKYVVQ